MSLVRGSAHHHRADRGRAARGHVGAGWALFVDALTWFAAAAMLLGRADPAAGCLGGPGAPGMVADLREGWDFFRRTTWLWVVVLAFGVLNAIHLGAMFTLGPVVAKDTIGEQGWGLVLSAESVGLLLMTLVLLRVPLQRRCCSACSASPRSACRWCCSAPIPSCGPLHGRVLRRRSRHRGLLDRLDLAMQENVDGADAVARLLLRRRWARSSRCRSVSSPTDRWGPRSATRRSLVVSGIAYVAICLLTLLSRSVRDLPRRPELDEPSGQPAA